MKHSDMIDHIAAESNVPPFRASVFLRVMCKFILKSILAKERVHLKGIGTFEIIDQKDQVRYDIGRKKRMIVRNARRIKFVPSRKLKTTINKDITIEYMEDKGGKNESEN